MAWQVLTRGAVMAASAAVIAVVGGPAAVQELGGAGTRDTVQQVAATGQVIHVTSSDGVRVTSSASASAGSTQDVIVGDGSPVDGDLAGETGATPSGTTTVAPRPALLTLTRLRPMMARAGRSTIVLQGVLTDGAGASAAGRVTLWRRDRSRWTRVVAGRRTSAGGVVQLVVAQRGVTAVYRLSVAAAPGYLAATSAELTVRR